MAEGIKRRFLLSSLLVGGLGIAIIVTAAEAGENAPEGSHSNILPQGRAATTVAVGEKAPDFTLPSTLGEDISLSQFQGKKHVLIEFYGADFDPT